MLEARDIACLRGERVVFAALSLALPAGAALLLTGANGAGKSTLLRMLAGLLRPAKGAVFWAGQDVAADPAAHAARLRYLSHQDALKPALTVAENLGFFAALWGGAVAPALAARVAPSDTLFVFARAAEGPRMPLAILKRSAAELPLSFTLDDSMAMSPELKLSGFANVVISARISKSGDAMPQSGDLEGQSAPLAGRSSGIELSIDRVRP